ncbi:MAG: type II toxin-antitoxin system HipA family toxin [Pseudomonadota bacterium]
MRKLEVRFTRSSDDERVVGTLAEDRGRTYFEYAPAFVETGLNLSPLKIPLETGLFEHRDLAFGPLPGLFDDSLPDGWGLLLMDRHLRSLGFPLAEVHALDRLAWLGRRTMGALTYHPPAEPAETTARFLDLQTLAEHARQVLEGKVSEVLPELARAGGSPGGARPKVLVGFDPGEERLLSGADELPESHEHWIVKFTPRGEGDDDGAIEYAYALMARAAGIAMPACRLFETSTGDLFFGVRRFDRERGRRLHMHSFGNLIHSNFRVPSLDYADLLKVTSVLTHNHQDVIEVFRRMVFNVLAHNRDDHVKNWAFLLDDGSGEWRLSPAFDLSPSSGPGGEHSMTVAGEGKSPQREHVNALAKSAGIGRAGRDEIVDQVTAAVRSWPRFARKAGLARESVARVGEMHLWTKSSSSSRGRAPEGKSTATNASRGPRTPSASRLRKR